MRRIIHRAIVCGLSFLAMFNSSQARELNWNNLLFSSIKLQKQFDYAKNADCYLRRFRKAIWDKYRNDEFELEAKRQESVKLLKDRIANFDLSKEFVVYTQFRIGKYNFKQQNFPLEALAPHSYFYDKV